MRKKQTPEAAFTSTSENLAETIDDLASQNAPLTPEQEKIIGSAIAKWYSAPFQQALNTAKKTAGQIIHPTEYPLASVAAEYGHAHIIAALIKSGVDVDESDSRGTTPALLAAYNGHDNVISALIKGGVDMTWGTRGYSPARLAASNGHANVIIALIKAGVDMTEAERDGKTPAEAAKQRGYTQIEKLINDHNNRQDYSTALNVPDTSNTPAP